jgi:citrate synthase
MLGVAPGDKTFQDYVRLYMVLHCDHEGGNVSAFTNYVVGSALSDLYLSTSAGLNGLAGPLHGLANQECLRYILDILAHFGGKVPTDEQLIKHAWDTLNSGRVIPGYGHAVLRATDPRFLSFLEFGQRCCSDSPVFQLVEKHFNLIPGVLQEHGKAKNPYPNVDAASGALLYHYGLTEFDYYTVLFGVSRVMGMSAQIIYARTVGAPIVRPKSIEWDGVREYFASA